MEKYRGVHERPTVSPPSFGDEATTMLSNAEDNLNKLKKKEPLLTIELQDETAVPKVFYEGKEITGKVRVSFDWLTNGMEPLSGGTKFNIEHCETGHKDLVKKGIGLRRGKYAIDKH